MESLSGDWELCGVGWGFGWARARQCTFCELCYILNKYIKQMDSDYSVLNTMGLQFSDLFVSMRVRNYA